MIGLPGRLMLLGRFSEFTFGRSKLPERCLIYGGVYGARRKDWVRRSFDRWNRIRGNWMKYAFATKKRRNYMVVFNVYGGSMTLELLRLLRDGGVKRVFFVGSLGAKDLPIGTIVLPSKVIDRAGPVLVDDPSNEIVEPDGNCFRRLREALHDLGVDHVDGTITSVPCVLHNLPEVKRLVEQDPTVLGVELEMSTFYYYSKRDGLENYALLYVSDNEQHSIISRAKNVREARRNALRTITCVALELM